jgi:tRNA-modifying protein YgfZ
MRFMMRVEVEDLTDSVAIVWSADPVAEEPSALVVRRAADSLGGAELFVPRGQLVDALGDGPRAGTWAYEARRIAAGVPRPGLDTDARTIPNEAGLIGVAVHLDKGCYRGQETVARVHTLGRPPRRLVLLLLDGTPERLPPVGAALTLDGRTVGFVGSSARHHELGAIALGLVKRNVPVDATLLADGIPAAQEPLVDPEVGLHVRPRLGVG